MTEYKYVACYPIKPENFRPYRLFFKVFETPAGGRVFPSSSWRVDTQLSIQPENWELGATKKKIFVFEKVYICCNAASLLIYPFMFNIFQL